MAKEYKKFETVCIRRYGLGIKACYGVDAAATVTYQGYNPGEIHDPKDAVKCFWLVPLARPGDYPAY